MLLLRVILLQRPSPSSLPAVAWLGCRTEPSCCRSCQHQLPPGCRYSCQPILHIQHSLTESTFCRMHPQQLLPHRTHWEQAWCPAGPACRPQTAPWRRGRTRWSLNQLLFICPSVLEAELKTKHGPAHCTGACNLQGQQTDSPLAAQCQQGRSVRQDAARTHMLQGRGQSDKEEPAAEEAASQPTCTQMHSHPGEGLAHAVLGRTPPPDENWRKEAAELHSLEVRQFILQHPFKVGKLARSPQDLTAAC